MKEMTFKALYELAKSKPTPAQAFISDVAAITHRSEHTIKMWVIGRQQPDDLVCAIIAKHFGVSASSLFPKSNLNHKRNERDC